MDNRTLIEISHVNYKPESEILSIIKKYDEEGYRIDTHYRKFYYYLDKVKNQHIFDNLQELVENIYTNKYLDVITQQFNKKFSFEGVREHINFKRIFTEIL